MKFSEMKFKSVVEHKLIAVIIVFAITGSTIIWDYFHGGVPTHFLLAREDLPGISNWWGMLTIPILTWITITLIEKRKEKDGKLDLQASLSDSKILTNFIGALVFGIIMSFFWESKLEEILQYLILFPIIISLFRPVHYPENLLGFALGMIYTFGGTLPLLIGAVLLLLSLFTNKIIRNGFLMLLAKFK